MTSSDSDQVTERALAVLPYFVGSIAVALAIALFQQLVRGERFQLLPLLDRALRIWIVLVLLSPLLLVAKCVVFFASIDGCINC